MDFKGNKQTFQRTDLQTKESKKTTKNQKSFFLNISFLVKQLKLIYFSLIKKDFEINQHNFELLTTYSILLHKKHI